MNKKLFSITSIIFFFLITACESGSPTETTAEEERVVVEVVEEPTEEKWAPGVEPSIEDYFPSGGWDLAGQVSDSTGNIINEETVYTYLFPSDYTWSNFHQIYLDDNDTGGFHLENIEPGPYLVLSFAEGYAPSVRSVDVFRDETAYVFAGLAPVDESVEVVPELETFVNVDDNVYMVLPPETLPNCTLQVTLLPPEASPLPTIMDDSYLVLGAWSMEIINAETRHLQNPVEFTAALNHIIDPGLFEDISEVSLFRFNLENLRWEELGDVGLEEEGGRIWFSTTLEDHFSSVVAVTKKHRIIHLETKETSDINDDGNTNLGDDLDSVAFIACNTTYTATNERQKTIIETEVSGINLGASLLKAGKKSLPQNQNLRL